MYGSCWTIWLCKRVFLKFIKRCIKGKVISLSDNDEILFVGTAEAEQDEMYLKAIWHIKERDEPVKISTIAKMIHVRQPSVVQM